MIETNKPNDTTQQLEDIRRQKVKEAYGSKPEENKKPEGEKKPEKKLDNDENNSYIVDTDSKYADIFENQFKGDPVKAVKSWSEAQKEYMKLRENSQKDKEYLDKISDLAEKNEIFREVLNRAENNEDIESFLKQKFVEPKGKPSSNEAKSKPNVTERLNEVDEKTLIESGYLEESERQFSTAEEWAQKRHQASMRYMYNELPDRLASEAANKYKEQIDRLEQERKQKQVKEQNEALIKKRYLDGLEKISTKYKLDFENNSEHEQLLQEIERRAAGITDINNPSVIDEDAVEMATDFILRKNGLLKELKAEETPKPDDKKIYARNQFNTNVRDRGERSPQSVAEKLKAKHLENFQRGLDRQGLNNQN